MILTRAAVARHRVCEQVAERERNELFMLYSASLANKGGGDAADDKAKLESDEDTAGSGLNCVLPVKATDPMVQPGAQQRGEQQ